MKPTFYMLVFGDAFIKQFKFSKAKGIWVPVDVVASGTRERFEVSLFWEF